MKFKYCAISFAHVSVVGNRYIGDLQESFLCLQTLFNPNKTVVKMFLVTYNFSDMPVNHMTFLRQRIFLAPVEEAGEGKEEGPPGGGVIDRKKILCYLIHLR